MIVNYNMLITWSIIWHPCPFLPIIQNVLAGPQIVDLSTVNELWEILFRPCYVEFSLFNCSEIRNFLSAKHKKKCLWKLFSVIERSVLSKRSLIVIRKPSIIFSGINLITIMNHSTFMDVHVRFIYIFFQNIIKTVSGNEVAI